MSFCIELTADLAARHVAKSRQRGRAAIVMDKTICRPSDVIGRWRKNWSQCKLFLAGWLVLALMVWPAISKGGSSVASVSPATNSVVTNLTHVTVTFTNSVLGVQPDDLLLNGVSATNVSNSGAVYTFTFSPPSPGTVQASWNGGHLITDLHTNRLTDLSGITWQYTLVDVVPPTASVISPVPGATLGQLTQIIVTFSEAVTGVNASDLKINGVSASSVTGSGAGPYTFYLSAPASGAVQVAWAANHGIHDLAAGANPFAGGSWTYSFHPGEFAGDIIINEFLSSNISTNGLHDEDGKLQDWIELYNRGTNVVNLLGWSLTDDPNVPNLWTFPAVTISPGEYRVVFASGKNRQPTNGDPLHTSFTLGASGQYLGLFNANQPQEVATCFTPAYPAQQANISYGLYGTIFTFLTNATPGAANTGPAIFNGAAEDPQASVQSGFFNQSFTLTLSTATVGADIRYTLDGSEPSSATGILYAGPITVAGSASRPTVNVRAVALRSDLLSSRVSTFSYIFPSAVLQQPALPAGFPSNWTTVYGAAFSADYQMDPKVLTNGTYSAMALQALTNLPAVSIVMDQAALFDPQIGIYANPFPPISDRSLWEQSCSAELILPDGSKGFLIDAGVRTQGATSRDPNRSRKNSLRLFFNDIFEGKLNDTVFKDSTRSSFNTLILDAGSNLRWHNRSDPQANLDQLIRDQFCSYLQMASGAPCWHARWVNLYLNGLYWGVYYMHERTDDNWAASYLGGDSSEYDVLRNTSVGLECMNGDTTAWNAMMSLVNSGLSDNAQYDQLCQYLDIDKFIDYMIINFWAGNTDWSNHNWYTCRHRDPTGKFTFQVWDAEYTLIETNLDITGVFQMGTPTGIHGLLRNNAEYRQRCADRIQRLFFNNGPLYVNSNSPAVNPAQPGNNRPGALYMQLEAVIDLATVLESARWGDANPDHVNTPFTRNVDFLKELNRLKTAYFPIRSSTVLNQFRTELLYPISSGVQAPVFNQYGGSAPSGFNLIMSAPAGSIYYTTNGTDPRVAYTAAVAPGALIYSGTPVVLKQSLTIKARAFNGTTWSPLSEATFAVAQPLIPVRITEINYDPPGGSQYEFVELKNTGSGSVDLSGCSFSGMTYIFPPGSIVPSSAVIVLAANDNPAAWSSRYPGVNVFGYYSGHLSNSGERLALLDPAGETIISVTYSHSPTNGWPNASAGSTLEINNLNGDPNDPANWRASSVSNSISGGTPGIISTPPTTGSVQINEILALNSTILTNSGTTPDWIELINTSNKTVSLAGWSLSNDGNARKFVFPSGTNIIAGGYLLVFCDSQTSAPGLHTGFDLSATSGETLFLYNAQTNRVDAVTFGSQAGHLSVGRISGVWQLNQPTPRAPNQAATVGTASSLSINEWLAGSLPGQSDWFELYNSSSLPVSLQGLYLGTSKAMFQVKSLSFVPPGGFAKLTADESPGPNHVDFKLSTAGDELDLYDMFGSELSSVTWGPQSDGVSQGCLPDGSANIVNFPGSASPGASNYVVSYTGTGLQLNEVMARNDSAVVNPWGGYSDWIELYNPAATATNLSGMSLSVNQAQSGQWVFPSGTTIPAGGYLVIWCDSSRCHHNQSPGEFQPWPIAGWQ